MSNSGMKKNILMVEDTASVAALYRSYLQPLGADVCIVHSGQQALNELEDNQDYNLILLDLRLPDISGFEVLTHIRQRNNDIPVVIMTAHGSIDSAVEALRHGATDFLIKPCEAVQLRTTVTNVLKTKTQYRISPKTGANTFFGFIGRSACMQGVYRVIDSAAPSKATVFITGESGTGKEVCAEAIHQASPRHQHAFIAINCAAIPKDLIESELFGHVKGAFTGAAIERQGAVELADGGTLFLDEICEMDLDLQSKLLRFIQTGSFQKVGSSRVKQVDVRFICATNRNPWEEVKRGHFREDLYYRLHVIPLHLPPLRERGEDVLEIAQSLLVNFSIEENKEFTQFSPPVIERLLSFSWPGNVRELQNIIRNIVVLNNGVSVTEAMLPSPLSAIVGVKLASESTKLTTTASGAETIAPVFEAAENTNAQTKADIEPLWLVEKKAIQHAIALCGGNVPQAAGLLEVSPSTLYRKLQSWK